MTISKRVVPVCVIHGDGKIEQSLFNQLIETTVNETDGTDIVRVIEEDLNSAVLHPSQGDYISKVASLRDATSDSDAKNVLDSIVVGAESTRNVEIERKHQAKREKCVELEKVVAEQKKTIAGLQKVEAVK